MARQERCHACLQIEVIVRIRAAIQFRLIVDLSLKTLSGDFPPRVRAILPVCGGIITCLTGKEAVGNSATARVAISFNQAPCDQLVAASAKGLAIDIEELCELRLPLVVCPSLVGHRAHSNEHRIAQWAQAFLANS